MGDYNVQIISARIKKPPTLDDNQLREEILERLPLCDSAYHGTNPFVNVGTDSIGTYVSLITQAKWNRGVNEFLDWFEPMVCQGIGEDDVWSINYSEYSGEPTIRKTKYKE